MHECTRISAFSGNSNIFPKLISNELHVVVFLTNFSTGSHT